MNVEDEVKKLFFEVFPMMPEGDFDWNKQQKDYENWDSFAHLHIITLAEERFNITLTMDESISLDSAKRLVDYIRSHR